MKLIETYKYLFNELIQLYEERESRSIVLLLLEAAGLNNLMISLEPSLVLTEKQTIFLENKLNELLQNKPVQYVLGKADFHDLTFMVNENVLIPRPETEELVAMIIKEYSGLKPVILDIGTGSGCIAITISKYLRNAKVFATDISKEALEIAKKNAEINKVPVKFIRDDIINPSYSWKKETFDLIISNPPYVYKKDIPEMKPNVSQYEPALALYAPDPDPFLFYRKIFDFALKYMKDGGLLFCEINEKAGREIENIAENYMLKEIRIIEDINDKERFLKCRIIR